MVAAKLKTGLWVKARIRQCDVDGIPAMVLRRGDPDAGAILVKLNRLNTGCRVFTQFRNMEGETTWVSATGDAPVDDKAADAYIARQASRDRDIWVLEIEDHRGDFTLEED
ncbi:MAG: DUF1491 family protein [Rhodospirillales bacterium]|nr:DUF1491 family protein [Rhodospirillales bacterium]